MLAQLVHSDQPVAVTGEDDEFIGMLSRKKVVELVTPALSETAPAEGAEAAPDLPQPEGGAEVQAGPERRDELPDAPPARHPASLPRCASRRRSVGQGPGSIHDGPGPLHAGAPWL